MPRIPMWILVGPDGSVSAPQSMWLATANKVAGLIRLPFDGNPSRGMGLVAHPAAIGDAAFSADGAAFDKGQTTWP